MKKGVLIKNVIVLLAITIVAVFLLSLVYQLTLAPIAQVQADKQAASYRAMYSDAYQLTVMESAETAVATAADDLAANYNGATVSDVMAVTNASGELVGYAVSASSPKGYGGTVSVALAIDITGEAAAVNGLRVLEQSETAGFGAVCANESYWGQYTDAGYTSGDQADVISGATYTTTAIRDAVDAALAFVTDIDRYQEG